MSIKVELGFDDLERVIASMTSVPAFAEQTLDETRGAAKWLSELKDNLAENYRDRYWRLCAIVAELFYHFGQLGEAAQMLVEGDEVFRQLPERVSPSLDSTERLRLRNRLRFVSDHAFLKNYHAGEVHSCLAKLDRCVALIENGGLRTRESRCLETLGRLYLYRGQTCHLIGRDDEALANLRMALSLYADKLESILDDRRRVDATQRLQWLRHKSVEVLLALGSAYYGQGFLEQALSYISAAQIMYVHWGHEAFADDLTRASIALRRVAIRRGQLGPRSSETTDQIADLNRALKTFDRYHHAIGILRTKYELALCLMYDAGSYEQVRLYLGDVKREALAVGDHRWLCYADCRLSMATPNANEALALATQALEEAEGRRLQICQTDALLARAEALLRLPDQTAKARQDLNRVLELDHRTLNPRLRVRRELLMARSYVYESKAEDADEWLRRAATSMPVIEHASLRDLFDRVRSERESLGDDFRVQVVDQRPYETHAREFRRWLVERARRHHGTDRAVADALDISRVTLRKWEREMSPRKGTARRRRKRDR